MNATELKIGDKVAIQFPCCPGGGLKNAVVTKKEPWGAWAKIEGEAHTEALDLPDNPGGVGGGWWKL